MRVVITGGCGFLGMMLARRLVERGWLTGPSGERREIESLALFDAVTPTVRPKGLDERVTVAAGDIADRDTLLGLIDRDDVSVFHLASVVSGGGEQDFDLALRVNLDGMLAVLDACRARVSRPRVVFASSLAIFGGTAMAKTVGDTTKPGPQTTYGATKAIGELLINDYTRKGFLDGRTARLPTIVIRPGKPNAAASSFVSGLFREPLNGVDCVVPVPLETRMAILGYRQAVAGFIALHEADGGRIGDDRALNLPSLSVTVGQMVESLKRVAGNRRLGNIRVAIDPFVERIVTAWPEEMLWDRARALGMTTGGDVDAIVRGYMEDFPPT